VAARHKGATVRRGGERPSVPFHPARPASSQRPVPRRVPPVRSSGNRAGLTAGDAPRPADEMRDRGVHWRDRGVHWIGLALLARTSAESPQATDAPSARGEEPRQTEFDSQGQYGPGVSALRRRSPRGYRFAYLPRCARPACALGRSGAASARTERQQTMGWRSRDGPSGTLTTCLHRSIFPTGAIQAFTQWERGKQCERRRCSC